MRNYEDMTVDELKQLINEIENEINSRTGFDAEFNVGSKAYKGCTYKQIQLAEKLARDTGSKILVNHSKLQKKFEMDEMSEAIDMMKEGKIIKIS